MQAFVYQTDMTVLVSATCYELLRAACRNKRRAPAAAAPKDNLRPYHPWELPSSPSTYGEPCPQVSAKACATVAHTKEIWPNAEADLDLTASV